jgi:outer membrane immunogenic protein
MRCFRTVVAIVFFASVSSFAGIDLTIGGGLNISDLTLTGDYKLDNIYLAYGQTQSMLIGFNAGANARFSFNDKMGLVAGLNFETRGDKIKKSNKYGAGSYTTTLTMHYLQVPVLFSYKFLPELAVNIGPEAGIFLGGTSKDEGDQTGSTDQKDLVKAFDIGASIQATYTIARMIVVGAGYDLGFMNTDKSPNGKSGAAKNNNIKVTAAYLLHL